MSYNAFSDRKQWADNGFKNYEDFSECIEYVNQYEFGDGQLEGEWYYCDDTTLIVYYGSFGNDTSPGAASYTYAERYDTAEEYAAEKARWEAFPEYGETEPSEDYEPEYDNLEEEIEEGDYTTEDHIKFYQYGKLVLTVPTGHSYKKLVRAHMTAGNYFPNVWFVSNHGNTLLLNVYDDDDE